MARKPRIEYDGAFFHVITLEKVVEKHEEKSKNGAERRNTPCPG
jgi:hypothetical protein